MAIQNYPDIDPFDRDPDYDEGEEDFEDDNDSWDCSYPSECLMRYTDHMRLGVLHG